MTTPGSDTPSPAPRRASAVQRGLMRAMVGLYRRTGGRIGGRVGSTPVLLLTTTGRKSGASHTVAVGYFDQGDVRFVVASNGGAPRHPAWYFNLTAHPEVQVEVGRESYRAVARVAAGEERTRLWNHVMETAPPYRRYQRTAREIPLVVLDRTK
ncbi:MAG TPA: nitroreductase family deazaflavin-dependent oxidoreductase [Ktedonobacterales bacterium]|nr:nitroreductase family deazaflavin-dependent oxidoreductase [Ktedonobacterales bacterium]